MENGPYDAATAKEYVYHHFSPIQHTLVNGHFVNLYLKNGKNYSKTRETLQELFPNVTIETHWVATRYKIMKDYQSFLKNIKGTGPQPLLKFLQKPINTISIDPNTKPEPLPKIDPVLKTNSFFFQSSFAVVCMFCLNDFLVMVLF